MNRDEAEGTVDQGVGKAKETFGKVTGDKQTEAEGQNQQVEGQLHKGVGKVKDTADNVAKRADDAARRASDKLNKDD